MERGGRACVCPEPYHTIAHLGPEVYGEGDGLHGVWVAPDEEAAEEDTREAEALGVEVRQLPDIVRQHPAQCHSQVRRLKIRQVFVVCASRVCEISGGQGLLGFYIFVRSD